MSLAAPGVVDVIVVGHVGVGLVRCVADDGKVALPVVPVAAAALGRPRRCAAGAHAGEVFLVRHVVRVVSLCPGLRARAHTGASHAEKREDAKIRCIQTWHLPEAMREHGIKMETGRGQGCKMKGEGAERDARG